jgi:hypothetical protein
MATGLHGKLSTPAVVGMNSRGLLAGAISSGPAARILAAAEAVQVITPFASPVTVAVSPGRVHAGTPGWPFREGGAAAETRTGETIAVAEGTAVGLRVAVTVTGTVLVAALVAVREAVVEMVAVRVALRVLVAIPGTVAVLVAWGVVVVVAVALAVAVAVLVGIGVTVAVLVARGVVVDVAVALGVAVAVLMPVGVAVAVLVGLRVAVAELVGGAAPTRTMEGTRVTGTSEVVKTTTSPISFVICVPRGVVASIWSTKENV